ncbi:MAG: hypothetical protein ACP5G2_04795 [Candidatus Bipolaricaulaceae bacterium]
MDGSRGFALVQDTMEEALLFRQKMAQIEGQVRRERLEERRWWFDTWQPKGDPDTLAELLEDVRSEAGAATDDRTFARQLDFWTLRPGHSWHGFDKLGQGTVLLDPTKVTILTPGLAPDGTATPTGIPAAVVAAFLRARGIVVEKSGFYSFLVLFTLGITKGKSGSLLAELLDFKAFYDANAPLARVFPHLVKRAPGTYQGLGLRDLCQQMHTHLQTTEILSLANQIYARLPQPVITPAEAHRRLVEGQVKRVPISELVGCTSAVMVVPYPPGIPILIPGEQVTQETAAIRDYLLFFEEFNRNYPGFEVQLHGLSLETGADGRGQHAPYCIS